MTNWQSPLDRAEALAIVRWLGAPTPSATRGWFDALLAAWGQRVPWESASRIARRRTLPPAACVMHPRAFWQAAVDRGLGGTCFETNAALAALLAGLGFDYSLTINDRPPFPASHTALVVSTGAQRLLVDAGFPVYGALAVPAGDVPESCQTAWGSFGATRIGAHRYQITQFPHPRPLAFELIDIAVDPAAYAAATCADYGPDGLFLDQVVIKKIVDGAVWRFSSRETPWVLERFHRGARAVQALPAGHDAAVATLTKHFAVHPETLSEALTAVAARAD